MAKQDGDGSDELRVPFVFVPNGAPDPVEWMNAHPGWVRIPATFRPDAKPAFIHPDAALPTGTPTPRFPQGTPISLGAVDPRRRDHSRFSRSRNPPGMNEMTSRIDEAADYQRFKQIMDDAVRAGASADFAAATFVPPPSQSAAELIKAADEPAPEPHSAIRSLPQNASTNSIRLASQDPPETGQQDEPERRPLSRRDEINRSEYNAAVDALRKLGPNNPAPTTVTGPEYVPSGADVTHIREVLTRVQQHDLETAPDEKAGQRSPIPSIKSVVPNGTD